MTVSLLSEIQSIAPDEINKRGEDLFKNRSLFMLSGTKDSNIKVKVPGNIEDHYIVEIPPKNSKKISCSCIYSQSSLYCKHIIAALLFIDELKRDAVKELDFTVKTQPNDRAMHHKPPKNQVHNERRRTFQTYYIKVPEDATDFTWLKKHLYVNSYDWNLDSVTLAGDILQLIIKNEYSYYETDKTVELSYKDHHINIKCTCNAHTRKICQHENLALSYLINNLDFKVLHHLDLNYQNELKLKYLKTVMPDVPEQETDDYVKVILKKDIETIPHKKAEGLYDIEKTSRVLHETVNFFSGAEKSLKLELPKEQSDVADQLIHGYAYVFDEEYLFLFDMSLLQGKSNKNRDKIASSLREIVFTEDFEGELPADAISFLRKKNTLREIAPTIRDVQDFSKINVLFQASAELFSLVSNQIIYYKIGDIYDDIRKSDLKHTSIISKKATISFKLEEEDAFYKLEAFCHLEEADILFPVSELKMIHAFIGLYQGKLFHLGRVKDYAILQHAMKYPVKRVIKDDYDQFYKGIITPLQQNFNISIKMQNAEVKKVQLIPEKKKLYISEFDKFVVLTPEVSYKENEQVNVLENKSLWEKNGKAVIEKIRDKKFEVDFLQEVRSLHPDFKEKGAQGFFHLTAEKMIENQWFLSAFEKLRSSGVELYGLNELKNFRYSTHQPKINIHIESRQDWFDTTLEISYGNSKVSVKDLKKALKDNDKFIQLDDGTLGMLPLDWLEKFRRLFREGKQVKDKLQISKLNFNLINEYVDPEKNIGLFQELQAKKKRLQSFSGITKTKVPKNINAKLRGYQKEGLNWLNFLDEFGWGGILADDMGLGKTLQIITFLQLQKNNGVKLPSLIIAPTSLLFNWKDELQKFGPKLSFLLHYGQNRTKDTKVFAKNDLVVTSYGTLVNDLDLLSGFKFNYVVLDESQAIKNIMSQRYKAAIRLQARNKLALTGTPVENSVLELYAQMSFVNPGFLNSIKHFKDNFIKPIETEQNTMLAKELRQKISPFILRRTKKEVLKELPEKTEENLYCIMSPEQQKVYDAYRNKYRDYLLGLIDDEGLNNSVIHVLEGMTKLRQVCNSPKLLESERLEVSDSIKIKELKRHIKEKTGDHKVLIFSQFVKMLNLIEKELAAEGIPYEMLHGGTSAKQREIKVNRFQNDEDCRVFLISLKAGGMGLNLTKAEYVYIVDPWWNPAVENQAIDRCYRIGQKKNVTAYRMICKDTIEEKIMELQKQKRHLADNLLESGGGPAKKLTRQDIEKLFS